MYKWKFPCVSTSIYKTSMCFYSDRIGKMSIVFFVFVFFFFAGGGACCGA